MRKLVAAVVVAALAAGCGAASSAPAGFGARAKQPGLVTSARPSPCVTNAGYGGLGGISRRFDANNNGSTGPAEPTPGAAWYQVLATARGCVIAYSVQDSAAPPLGTRDVLALVKSYLPPDARQVTTTRSCAVWESASLRRATGLLYARATAIAQIGSLRPGSAEMRATGRPSCYEHRPASG